MLDQEKDLLKWTEIRVNRMRWLIHNKPVVDARRKKNRIDFEVYDTIVNNLLMLDNFIKHLLDGSLCIKDCKSLCCYFSPTELDRVALTKDELSELKEILNDEVENPEDYYTMIPLDQIGGVLRKHIDNDPEFIFNNNNVKNVCFLNTSDHKINPELLKNMPHSGRKYKRMWVTNESCACPFLSENNGCTMYNRLRFSVCKEYYCLTALTAGIMMKLGYTGEELLELPLKDANQIAEAISRSFEDAKLLEYEKHYDNLMKELTINYLKDKTSEREHKKISEYQKEYDNEMKKAIEKVLNRYQGFISV